MRKFPVWFFILLFCANGYTQNYRVESITVADGLSQGFVIALFQDSRGFTWIGTSNGLNRYDGYQIKQFTPDNTAPPALKASVIYCIAEDSDGLLWFGTEKGLVVMDPYTEQFTHLAEINPAFPNSKIVQLIIRDGGRIWFCDQKGEKSGVYVTRPPHDLTRLIREGRLRSGDFTLQTVRLSGGISLPFGWFLNSSDSVVGGIDRLGHFCRIDPATLQGHRADLRTMHYTRWGNYGLVYSPQGTGGTVFQLTDTKNQQQARAFLQAPGEMPVIYYTGEPVLLQLDTVFTQRKAPVFDEKDFYQEFKTFIQLDKPVSYKGIVDLVGNIWMGTTGYGVQKISRRKLDFRQYLPEQSFYNFTLLPDGRIWPGYYRPNQVLNLQTNKLEEAPWTDALPKKAHASSLLITRSGDWWIEAWQEHRMLIFKKEAGSRQWKEVPIQLKFVDGFPVPLLEDSRGRIWLAGIKGEIIRIRPTDNHVDRWQVGAYFPASSPDPLRGTCLVEDAGGAIWVGCNDGLVKIEHPEGVPKFQTWNKGTDKGTPFKSDYIMSLYPDPNDTGIIWIGTRSGGLSRFNSQNGTCETFTKKDGLADNVIYGILPDAFGYLWLSTNRGLSRFNPRNRTFSNSPNAEPKLNVEFNTGAYGLMPSGELAFGSVEGLFLIRPFPELRNERPYIVEVTQVKINGTALDPTITKAGLTFTAQNEVSLQVPFDQNNILLEFAALQTDDPASAQYRYRVLGLEEHWIQNGHQRTVNLAAIPPGEYTIELQSIGTNGSWAEAPLSRVYVHILPPWYRSWFAWWLYAGLVSLLLYGYIRYERRQLLLKYEVNIGRKEMERLKSLDDFKNRFFSYISHEFKTPLTIIMGWAKRLPEEGNPEEIAKNAGSILHQSQSMLEMVDQMVDITKLENQELRLNLRNGNFSNYVRYLVESLRTLTDFKNIRLDFQSVAPELLIDFDPLRLKYIVHNLLINALQHTAPGGTISVSIYRQAITGEGRHPERTDQIYLDVLDTGKGIAPEDLPNIFDRYYQGNSNHPQPHHFGLGLAFVKDLLQLFEGNIDVRSQLGSGTVFTISLPITHNAPPLEHSGYDHSPAPNHFSNQAVSTRVPKKLLPLLLVVEDNPFISSFLQTILEPHFQMEFAPDGLSGYEKALETIPDLILMDVMMPGIDGYDLTQRLKSHELSGHIPIVILSARAGLSDRLTGQQYGADAYLGKPFDEQELVLILQNLHRLQHRWRKRYAGLSEKAGLPDDLTWETSEQPAETVRQTDAFMLRLYVLFEKNYPDEGYDLLQLCHDLEMSKSQLQRKLAVLSDQSAMQLLRRYRLQKAYQILSKNSDYTVKEICFRIGFKDPSHFSRLFSQTFHTTPSNVKKK